MARGGPAVSRPNVLYVTVDSIRADHTGHLGYDRPTTPTIDHLAERGTVCQKTFASGIPTFYAFKSLLGGVPALGHTRDVGMPERARPLAEWFRDCGYETAGFNAGNPWLTREYGYDRGFETFRDFLTDDTDDGSDLGRQVTKFARRLQPYVAWSAVLEDKLGLATRIAFVFAGHTPVESAETVTDAAVEWLRHWDGTRPFFLWVHYMDPHYPWTPRSVDLDCFAEGSVSSIDVARLWHEVSSHDHTADGHDLSPDQLGDAIDLYDAEIRRTDEAIGRLLDALGGARDDTLVSVVGDHGTELGDHGGFSHGPRTLYEEVLRVPLVFAGPSVPDRERASVTSLLDVPYSVLDAAGIEHDPDPPLGVSVFDGGRESAVSEVVYDYEPRSGANRDNGLLRACVDWPWKLIVNGELGSPELYHLERDTGERTDVSADNPGVVERLTGTLDATRGRIEYRNNTVAEKARVRATLSDLERRGLI